MFKIKKELPTVPITALHFCGDILLSGEGTFLVAYDLLTNECQSSTEVFSAANVHGIISHGKSIAVFGGKCLRFLLFSAKTRRLQLQGDEVMLPDWIQTVQWLSEGQPKDGGDCDEVVLPGRLAAALSHNVVVLLDTRTGNILWEVHCEDKCILYSAHFIGRQWRHLVLAAGTVFNQAVIWPVVEMVSDKGQVGSEVNTASSASVAKVMHRLDRHQGVIFSITTHAARQLLCSVSDDRSVHLWKITSACANLNLSDWTHDNWARATFDLIHILYGHTARVWQAVLLGNSLVSIGEDSCCIQWSYDGQIQKRFKGHKGRSIWSVACSEDEKYVATGGGDSSIRITPLDTKHGQGSANRWRSRNLEACKDQVDFPKIVRFVGAGKILLITNEGLLQCYDRSKETWHTVMSDHRFFSYCVVEATIKTSLVALGSVRGLVKLVSLDGSTELEQQLFDGKVLSLSLLETKDNERKIYLLANGADGILIFQLLVLTHQDWHVRDVKKFYLPPKKQCWLTAACILDSSSMLICGDRGGTLHVYDLACNQNSNTAVQPMQNFPRIHSKAGLTDIHPYEEHIYTCGRDGHYRMYQVDSGRLHLLQANRVKKGMDWLTRFVQLGENLLILGFYMEQLMVYNISQSELLLAVPCGGGHRAWDFILNDYPSDPSAKQVETHSQDGSSGRFVYIKRKDVILCDVELSSHCNVLKPALHGREINDIHYLFTQTDDVQAAFLATAGEDNVVNIVQWNQTNSDIRSVNVIARLQGHISSVRSLAASKSYKCSEFSNATILLSGGGRAQLVAWRIWPSGLTLDGNESQMHSEEASVKNSHRNQTVFSPDLGMRNSSTRWHYRSEQLANYMVIEDGGIRTSRTWRSKECVLDPETRIMSITMFTLNDLDYALPRSVHLVVLGCSDAVLRFLLFSETTASFQCIAESSFHEHCILKVKHLLVPSTSSSSSSVPSCRAIVFSAGTDGRIALWDITKLIYMRVRSPRATHKHQHPEDVHEDRGDIDENVEVSDQSVIKDNCSDDMSQSSANGSSIYDTQSGYPADGTSIYSTQSDYPDGENPDDLQEPLWCCQCHQSGINSLTTRRMTDLTYLIASGGDDNAICVLVITLSVTNDKLTVDVLKCFSKKDAHAAQVTGLAILNDELLLSVSIDQRAVLWRVDHANMQLTQTSSVFLNVADVSELAVWRNSPDDKYRGMACGVGVQGFSTEAVG